ncbi:hypothetical protein O181_063533 [Austropuccinia psidii MF-1]|uniref:Uncharacterized protein n=1 Tax=Austropuccinia psidii MF-1 TaxID=1389203 RepID=A0A9Q3ELI4_9BASI|nr:hypothetical protein [Austropuccinia psidii MF-1]
MPIMVENSLAISQSSFMKPINPEKSLFSFFLGDWLQHCLSSLADNLRKGAWSLACLHSQWSSMANREGFIHQLPAERPKRIFTELTISMDCLGNGNQRSSQLSKTGTRAEFRNKLKSKPSISSRIACLASAVDEPGPASRLLSSIQLMKLQKPIKAIVFDIGGVVVKSPLLGVNKFERILKLPPDYLNVAITARGPTGAFQCLETGRLQLTEFYQQFGKEMSDTDFNNAAYVKFCSKARKPCPPLPHSVQINGKELWQCMMSESSVYNQPIVSAIKSLRGHYKVVALTNNFQLPLGVNEGDKDALGLASEKLKALFDDYIESSQVGLRKPDPQIFRYTLDKLGLQPEQVVFLDDIGINLKAAQKLKINTIRVGIHDVKPAIRQLQAFVLDVNLEACINESKL